MLVWTDLYSCSNKAVLEPRVSPAFAITYFCNHCNIRFETTSKYVDTLTLFSKNLNQRSLTPRWPLTPCLLRSHVWLYPRIIVSKSHGNTSMYVDTVINLANYHMHTPSTYYVHTTYRMSDHIVSYWTQFRWDNYWTQFKRDKKQRGLCFSFPACSHDVPIFFFLTWVGRNKVSKESCSESQHNGLEVGCATSLYLTTVGMPGPQFRPSLRGSKLTETATFTTWFTGLWNPWESGSAALRN